MNREELKKRAHQVADELVSEKGYVSPVDLLMRMGKLTLKDHEDWRRGRVPYLERVCSMNLAKLAVTMKELERYARCENLKPSRTVYMRWGKGCKQKLRFTTSGKPHIEELYSTHYVVQKHG